jgi:hypothetical protein
MRILVLLKVDDLQVSDAIDLVTQDEAPRGELREQFIDVAGVVRQDFRLDLLDALDHSPGPISRTPEPGEQDSGQRLALGELVIREERRFQIASSHAARRI